MSYVERAREEKRANYKIKFDIYIQYYIYIYKNRISHIN